MNINKIINQKGFFIGLGIALAMFKLLWIMLYFNLNMFHFFELASIIALTVIGLVGSIYAKTNSRNSILVGNICTGILAGLYTYFIGVVLFFIFIATWASN